MNNDSDDPVSDAKFRQVLQAATPEQFGAILELLEHDPNTTKKLVASVQKYLRKHGVSDL
jgi:hypothetical protein